MMLFGLRARRCGTLQVLSDGDGLARKPMSDYVVCIMTVVLKVVWAPPSRLALLCRGWMAAAASDGRVILSSLLADFAVRGSHGRNSSSTEAKTTRGDARWPVETVAAAGW
jgi:hypothetical protein